jgi:hypothetical protein
MARDIEADVKINDKSAPGLESVKRRVKRTNDDIKKEYDRFGKSTGEAILNGIGAVSPKLAASLAGGIGDAASLGAPLLIAGIAATAPIISGLVGAAVAGGAAGAGIIGGVALASRDARVKAAGTTLASNLLATLSTQASPFIEPVLHSIDKIGERFSQNGDKIEHIFANSARFVEPLADTFLDLGDNLISGLDTAIGRAGPVMAGLESGIEAVGSSIESFIDDVTANAGFNGQVLEDTLQAVAFTIEATGRSLKFLSDVFQIVDKVIPISPLTKLSHAFEDTDAAGRRSAGGTFGAAQGMQIAGDAAETSAADTKLYEKALQDNAKAAEDAASAQRSLFDDTTRVGEANDKASEAARKNGRTMSANTEKGRANREALSSLASAFNGYRGNLEKSGASAGRVNSVMSTQRSRLIAVAQSMGASSSRARRLADSLLGIKNRSVKVTANTAQAQAEARNARQEIASIRGKSVTVTVRVNDSQLRNVERRLARAGGANAAGADSFGAMAPGQTARTGGPLTVENTTNVVLDGRRIYSYTDKKIADERKRVAFRSKVGTR